MPLELTYETLAQNFDGTFRRVMDFLGVEIDRVPEPPTERLYDELSEEWLRRFVDTAQNRQASTSGVRQAGPDSMDRSASMKSQS